MFCRSEVNRSKRLVCSLFQPSIITDITRPKSKGPKGEGEWERRRRMVVLTAGHLL